MMMQHTPLRRTRRRGFTLAEVLISLGIFAIGMIAVASLFPVALILQKETADDILGQQAATNARATMEAIGLTYFDPNTVFADDLDNYHAASDTRYGAGTLQFSGVVPINDLTSEPGGTSFFNRFTLAERSYPSTDLNALPNTYETRDHYWFFFVRDSAGVPTTPNWQGFILIVERGKGQNFAAVDAGLTLGVPTGQNTRYITIDGKTGIWDIENPPAVAGGDVFFHPAGIAVETFSFETIVPVP